MRVQARKQSIRERRKKKQNPNSRAAADCVRFTAAVIRFPVPYRIGLPSLVDRTDKC